MKQRIIITGGCGFIGSNFLNKYALLHPEIDFINIDTLTYAGKIENISPKLQNAPNYFFEKGDIREFDKLKALYQKYSPTDIIHFAAESHVCTSIKNPRLFTEVNVIGTQNLLDMHREFGLKRFHYVSTDEVYGDAGEILLFTEESPLKPSNPYSASKAAGDALVMAYGRTYHLDYTLSRCSNNYGPNQQREKLIPLCIDCAKKNEKIPLHGNGSYIRDWIYVEDHCDAIWKIWSSAKSASLYNVSAYQEYSNLEIAEMILNSLKKNVSTIRFVENRPGYDSRYALDASKIKNELAWSAKISFQEGLRKTLVSYL